MTPSIRSGSPWWFFALSKNFVFVEAVKLFAAYYEFTNKKGIGLLVLLEGYGRFLRISMPTMATAIIMAIPVPMMYISSGGN